MHKGQEQFLEFVIEHTQKDQKATARTLLLEAFQRQENGGFSKEDLERLNGNLLALLRPESVDEVAAVLNQFGDQHIS